MRATSRCLISAFLAGALVASGWAQVTVNLPAAAPYKAWYAADDLQPRDTVEGDAQSLSLSTPDAGMNLLVLNQRTNNLAIRPITDIKDGVITLKAADFTRIGTVQVKITYAGKPVVSASVSLKSKSVDKTALLSPSDNGVLRFWALPAGDYAVTVTYKSNGQAKTLDPAPRYQLSLNRSKPEVSFNVDLPEATDVVTSSTPVGPGAAQAVPSGVEAPVGTKLPPEKSNPFGSFVMFIIALGCGAAFIVLLLRLLKHNQTKVEEQLGKLGVSIPKDPDPQADDSAPQMPAAPEPVQPIVLDPGPPSIDLGSQDPISVAVTPVMAGVGAQPAAQAMPRLVAEDGAAYFLNETVTLGRDASASLAFPDQSTLSRQHAEVVVNGTSCALRDLGSTNGTFVNGVRIDGVGVQLRLGDQVQLGAMKLRYEE